MRGSARVALCGALVLLLAWPAAALAKDRVDLDRSHRHQPERVRAGPGLVADRQRRPQPAGAARLRGADRRPVAARPRASSTPTSGVTPSGATVAVYTRCAGVSGRNCDVYEFNFATSRERKLPGASSSRCSEFAPSVWQGAVAFARSGSQGLQRPLRQGAQGHAAASSSRRVPADTDFREGRVAYLHGRAASAPRSGLHDRRRAARGRHHRPAHGGRAHAGVVARPSAAATSTGCSRTCAASEFSVGRSRARSANPTLSVLRAHAAARARLDRARRPRALLHQRPRGLPGHRPAAELQGARG